MATNAELLAEAQAVYHTLLMGGGVRSVQDANGEKVEYSQANLDRLRAYILSLQAAPTSNGPLRPYF